MRANDRGFHGHINWYPAAYAGTIYYEGASESNGRIIGRLGDKDLNFLLVTPDSAGLTKYNNGALILEMDRRETAALWRSAWWRNLAASLLNTPETQERIDSMRARVIGLFGLDGVHDFHSELHPVYALALQTSRTRSAAHDQWAVFARNSGNEGYCSQHSHPLVLTSDTLFVELDWFPGATAVTLDQSSTFVPRGHGTEFIALRADPAARRVALVFVLPGATSTLVHAEQRAMIDGIAVLRWTVPDSVPSTATIASAARPSARPLDEAESTLDSLVASLPPSAKQSLERELDSLDLVEGAAHAMRERSAATVRLSPQKGRRGVQQGEFSAAQASASAAQIMPSVPSGVDRARDSIVARAICSQKQSAQLTQACSAWSSGAPR